MENDITKQISTLIRTFNDKRVVTEPEMKEVLAAIVGILAENKRGVDSISADAREQLAEAIKYMSGEHESVLVSLRGDLTKTRAEIEQSTKEQNARAFKRLQELISKIKLPKDGKDGKNGIGQPGTPGRDGSPDTPEEVRDKLETLVNDERLDAKHIKGLEKFFGTIKKNGKEMLVGGIRFFENLADVSIVPTKKRQDLIAQYDTTNNRWQDGIAITVSATEPTNPQINDLWVDIS